MNEKFYTDIPCGYLKNNPDWHSEDSEWKARQILKILKKNTIKIKNIAEVGCGVGEVLYQLKQKMSTNTTFTGYDISEEAIKQARKNEGDRLNFKNQDFLKISCKYNLLIMMDVFEHVSDYMGFITSCKKKADYIIFHIPLDIHILSILRNTPIKVRNKLGHLHYFTKETAIATLIDCGYEIIDSYYTDGALEHHNSKISTKIISIFRKLFYSINKNLAVKILGGYSLIVIAK